MLKLEFTLDTGTNAVIFGTLLQRIGAAISGPSFASDVSRTDTQIEVSPVVAEPPKRRGRPAKPDPVEAYVAAGGTMPTEPVATPDEPEVEEVAAANAVTPPPAEPVTAPVTPPPASTPAAPVTPPAGAPAADLDKLRQAVRDVANVKGAAWLIPHFAALNAKGGPKVTKVSELTVEQAQEILAGEAVS